MGDVTLVQQAHAGAPGDWRRDGGVGKVGPRGIDQRLILRHLGLQLRYLGARRIGLLRGGILVLNQLGIARLIDPGVGQQGFVLCLFRQRLIQCGLIPAGIDTGQNIALLDVLAFLKAHLDQLAIDHWFDGDGGGGLHGTEPVQPDRHVLAFSRGDQHGYGVHTSRARARGGFGGGPEPDHIANAGKQQKADQQPHAATPPRARAFGDRALCGVRDDANIWRVLGQPYAPRTGVSYRHSRVERQ